VNAHMPTTLILVRHGATAANTTRPYTLQGVRPDSELVDAGVRQAQAAGRALLAFPIRTIYSSPLRRARATAELIAAPQRLSVIVEDGLVEADVGTWSGLTWEEVEHRWPREFAAFHADAETNGYLGGENLAQVRDRVLPVVERLIAKHDDEMIAAVSHGVVNRVLLAHWLGLSLRLSRQLPQDNTGFNVIEFTGGRAKVRTVNAAGHLSLAAA
jgi:broad specificity phosphatase PhoE